MRISATSCTRRPPARRWTSAARASASRVSRASTSTPAGGERRSRSAPPSAPEYWQPGAYSTPAATYGPSRRPSSPGCSTTEAPDSFADGPPHLPANYPQFLAEIKARIAAARTRAVLAVNSELIKLYWEIGLTSFDRSPLVGRPKRVFFH